VGKSIGGHIPVDRTHSKRWYLVFIAYQNLSVERQVFQKTFLKKDRKNVTRPEESISATFTVPTHRIQKFLGQAVKMFHYGFGCSVSDSVSGQVFTWSSGRKIHLHSEQCSVDAFLLL
jgi:hypothetical protein